MSGPTSSSRCSTLLGFLTLDPLPDGVRRGHALVEALRLPASPATTCGRRRGTSALASAASAALAASTRRPATTCDLSGQRSLARCVAFCSGLEFGIPPTHSSLAAAAAEAVAAAATKPVSTSAAEAVATAAEAVAAAAATSSSSARASETPGEIGSRSPTAKSVAASAGRASPLYGATIPRRAPRHLSGHHLPRSLHLRRQLQLGRAAAATAATPATITVMVAAADATLLAVAAGLAAPLG